MLTLRHFAPAVGTALKTATRILVQDRVGGVEAAASACRATKSMLSDYGNPHTDRWIPADVLLDLERVGGEPLITAALARAQGYELVPVHPHHEGEFPQKLADIGRTVGALFATASDALADGMLTEAERLDLQRDLEAVRQVCGRTMAMLARQSGTVPATGAKASAGEDASSE